MNKEIIRQLALEQARDLNNKTTPFIRLSNSQRKTLIKYLRVSEQIEQLKKELQALDAPVRKLFDDYGVQFAKEGKSDYYAIAFRDNYICEYIVLRQGEDQTVVDYKAYAEAMGETSKSLTEAGYYSTRKGTDKISKPNKRQLDFLLDMFVDADVEG